MERLDVVEVYEYRRRRGFRPGRIAEGKLTYERPKPSANDKLKEPLPADRLEIGIRNPWELLVGLFDVQRNHDLLQLAPGAKVHGTDSPAAGRAELDLRPALVRE